MGYRSDGRWIIKGPADAVAAAYAELQRNPPEYTPSPMFLDDAPSIDEFKHYEDNSIGYIRFTFDDWKWYGQFPSVQWYEAVWTRLSENKALSGKRIHIGEDSAVTEDEFGDLYIELYAFAQFNDDEPEAP
jgi:hypothetical protein